MAPRCAYLGRQRVCGVAHALPGRRARFWAPVPFNPAGPSVVSRQRVEKRTVREFPLVANRRRGAPQSHPLRQIDAKAEDHPRGFVPGAAPTGATERLNPTPSAKSMRRRRITRGDSCPEQRQQAPRSASIPPPPPNRCEGGGSPAGIRARSSANRRRGAPQSHPLRQIDAKTEDHPRGFVPGAAPTGAAERLNPTLCAKSMRRRRTTRGDSCPERRQQAPRSASIPHSAPNRCEGGDLAERVSTSFRFSYPSTACHSHLPQITQ